jgi:uncharacterized membrane protein
VPASAQPPPLLSAAYPQLDQQLRHRLGTFDDRTRLKQRVAVASVSGTIYSTAQQLFKNFTVQQFAGVVQMGPSVCRIPAALNIETVSVSWVYVFTFLSVLL